MVILTVLPLALVMLLLPLAAIASGDPPWQHYCGSSGNYTAGSKYQANLQALAATLPSTASSSSPALFAKDAAGAGDAEPDRVFALTLRRGDTAANASSSSSSCADCASRALRDAQSVCPCSKEVAVYYDPCLLYFSGDDFLSSPANPAQVRLYDVDRSTRRGGGGADFVTLVRALLSYTMQWAVPYNSTGGDAAVRWYTTVRMDVVTPPLFSLMQCAPDMSGGDCRQCLQDLVGNTTFNGSVSGVRNIGARCGYRYDTYKFYGGEPKLRIGSLSEINSTAPPSPPPPPPVMETRSGRKKVLTVALLVPLIALCPVVIFCFAWIRRLRNHKSMLRKKDTMAREEVLKLWRLEESDSEFMLFDFSQIEDATSNFSEDKKLGEGGFGSVYKGQLPNGLEVAVKRLAAHSSQGLVEFKNEIQLIAKLQHTNLVNLRGCCIQGEENLLIYEYMPNKSLDFFIFDLKRAALLNWKIRLNIIEGITQGLLYLHKHSRLCIIHRDLKASNILLDRDMNPKISDFGLAKIFDSNDVQRNTKRVVGTYGYMAPEYASEGCFSLKSDVFSFGVLVLEIISGKRNAGFHQYGDFFNLLGYAWQLWKDGSWHELVDPSLVSEGQMMEIKKCMKVALLCVQENAVDRPTMSAVVKMLSSELKMLPEPKQPAFFNVRVKHGELSNTAPSSINDVTITIVNGR
uniref:non-specific serine/threonine protein kinase n=1 Tax=Oryza meridionalis TaxID=40149 RepID=A0A0E0EBB4_9ORYZ